jgi:hypothetical protein
MRSTATTVRCVPRFGFDNTEVRTVDVKVRRNAEERELASALQGWFIAHGISDAVYDIDVDDNGYFAIINDEAYDVTWGTPLL